MRRVMLALAAAMAILLTIPLAARNVQAAESTNVARQILEHDSARIDYAQYRRYRHYRRPYYRPRYGYHRRYNRPRPYYRPYYYHRPWGYRRYYW